MEKLKYLFIINPISGGIDKSTVIDFLATECIRHEYKYLFYRTTGEEDAEILAQFTNRFSFENVIAIGGDGTLNLAVSTFHHLKIPFGIIPMGSANGMWREISTLYDLKGPITFSLHDKIKYHWDVIEKGKANDYDALLVNQKHYCIHLGDIGLNAKIVKRFEQDRMRGYWGYTRQFIKEFYHKSKLKYKISIDQVRHKGKGYMIVMANAARYGNGAIINPGGRPDDGNLELCIVKNITFKSLLKSFRSIFSKNVSYLEKEITILPCRKATITLKKPQVLQLDGEILDDVGQVEVSILPGFFKLIH